MSSRARIAIVVVAIAALVVAFVVANGSDDDEQPTSAAATQAATVAPSTAAEPSTTTATTTATTPPAATTEAPPSIPVVEVVDAKPKGGIQRLTFDKGGTIRFTVQSDTADEIHVHGYDVHKDVTAGGRVTFSIPAKIDGRFVVELESHAVQIAELEVEP